MTMESPALMAIDPGTTESAFVVLNDHFGFIGNWGKVPNDGLLEEIHEFDHKNGCEGNAIVIEQVASYGMPVGEEVFTTVNWSGRFHQHADAREIAVHYLKRHDVKMRLCHQTKGVNDSVIRQRVIDVFGGKAAAIGNKKNPGPCFGMSGDVWQALALGVAWIGVENLAAKGD